MASSSKGRASSRKRSSAGKARVISTKRKDALPRTGSVAAGRRKPVVLPPIGALTEPPAKAVAARAKKAVAARAKKAHSLHQKERTGSRKKTTRAIGRASANLGDLTAMEIAQALAALEPVAVTALEPVAETIAAVEPPATAYEEFAVTAAEAPEVDALGLVETELDMEAFALAEELPPAGVAEAQALIAPAIEPATAPEPVADLVVAEDRPASAYEEFAVTAAEAPEVEAVAVADAELEVEASAVEEELPIDAMAALRIVIGPPPIPEETRETPLAGTAEAHAAPAPHDERRSPKPVISRLLSTLSRWTGVSGTK